MRNESDIIKFIREQKGLSQNKFGELLNVNQTTIARWEDENRIPTIDKAIDISLKLNIPLNDLVGRDLRIKEQKKKKQLSQEEEKELLKVMPHCISARWHPLFCDISPIGGTKQNGIDQFLKYYDIDLSETMAFGDGGNDIQMLEHVNISVAMGNAHDDVKKIAHYITDSVDDNGIVHALQHFNLI